MAVDQSFDLRIILKKLVGDSMSRNRFAFSQLDRHAVSSHVHFSDKLQRKDISGLWQNEYPCRTV